MTPTLEQLMAMADAFAAWQSPAGKHVLRSDLESTLRTLLARLVEAEGDARRYRWLRGGEKSRFGLTLERGGRIIQRDELRALMEFNFWCSKEELDAAIDAAMTDPLED